jgi:hypothetical protein
MPILATFLGFSALSFFQDEVVSFVLNLTVEDQASIAGYASQWRLAND